MTGFWIIQFAAPDENMEKNRQKFVDWAKKVEFTD
jgi:hypothetical protein